MTRYLPPARTLRALAAAAVCVLIAVAASSAGAVPPEKFDRQPARGIGPPRPCPRPPARFASRGSGTTFVYRIQHPWDVERLARQRAMWPDKLPLAMRDLFLVRARSYGAQRVDRMLDGLRDPAVLSGELFGCNRLIVMTGVHTGSGNPDEWMYSHATDPRVWSVAPDWERNIFHDSWPDTPGPDSKDPEPEWTGNPTTNAVRIRHAAAVIRRRGKPPGVVLTAWRGSWNYADVARRSRTEYQLLQTQSVCRKWGPSHFGRRARDLLRQYHKGGMPTATVALQISFSRHPNATPFLNDTVPGRAAACTTAAYGAGVRSFLLWGSPDDLDEYFAALPDRVRGDGCTISGGPGRNVLHGTRNRDVICGRGGNDRIFGGDGKDVLVGGPGNDRLRGEGGGDRLRGDAGADDLDGGKSYDVCTGGPGRDTLRIGCDRIPPTLESVQAAPPAAGSVRVTALISDDKAGIGPLQPNVALSFCSPSGAQTLDVRLDVANRLSGTATHGRYAGYVSVPVGAESGQWRLCGADIRDQADNRLSLDAAGLTAAGIEAGFAVP